MKKTFEISVSDIGPRGKKIGNVHNYLEAILGEYFHEYSIKSLE